MEGIKCEKCTLVFTLKQNMLRHFKTCGITEKTYVCVCGKPFKRLDGLKHHKKICKSVRGNVDVGPSSGGNVADGNDVGGNVGGGNVADENDLKENDDNGDVANGNIADENNRNENDLKENDDNGDGIDPFNDSFEDYLTPRFLDYIDKMYCAFCKLFLARNDVEKHYRSAIHKENAKINV